MADETTTRRVVIDIDIELDKEIKHAAIDLDMTRSDWIKRAIDKALHPSHKEKR